MDNMEFNIVDITDIVDTSGIMVIIGKIEDNEVVS